MPTCIAEVRRYNRVQTIPQAVTPSVPKLLYPFSTRNLAKTCEDLKSICTAFMHAVRKTQGMRCFGEEGSMKADARPPAVRAASQPLEFQWRWLCSMAVRY